MKLQNNRRKSTLIATSQRRVSILGDAQSPSPRRKRKRDEPADDGDAQPPPPSQKRKRDKPAHDIVMNDGCCCAWPEKCKDLRLQVAKEKKLPRFKPRLAAYPKITKVVPIHTRIT